ncbi:MAG: hypothetical protein C4304_07440, partial [candidate division GAL15 bacterium]
MRQARWIPALTYGLAALVVGAAAALLLLARPEPGAQRATPSPSSVSSPRPHRVAVVDLERVAREHPRARELRDLQQRIARTEAALALPLPPPPLPLPSVRPVTQRLREQAQEELARHAEELR